MVSRQARRAAGAIELRGVRQNNLQNIDLDIGLGELTVITGVSGSGKSSLAFDTLYAEGQRRYLETFSAYTRQFLERLARPDADSIDGIPPAVAIDQSGAIKSSRSTVGTLTGVNDYLKLLYARSAQVFCPGCRREIAPEDARAVAAHLAALDPQAFPALVTAPVSAGGASPESTALVLRAQGFLRFLRGGEVCRIEELAAADLAQGAIEIVVDRLTSPAVSRQRAVDSIETAFRLGRGTARVVTRGEARTFTRGLRCDGCGVSVRSPTPGAFSFNTPYGACPRCRGFGRTMDIDWSRVVPDPRLSIRGGAIRPWTTSSRRGRLRRCLAACSKRGVDVARPWSELSAEEQRFVLEGADGWAGVRGFFDRLEEKKYKMHVRVLLSRYRGYFTCSACGGARLRPDALACRVGGLTLPEMWSLPAHELSARIEALRAARPSRPVRLLIDEVASRLSYLVDVGLGYLTLDRQSRTLSGGEVERVNLTSALGASLVDTLFVLDEPSIGLHARDNDRLMAILGRVRDRGNTVVVVEHDPAIIRAADRVVDLGPGAGSEGGKVVACGTPAELSRHPESLTGAYLAGRRCVPARTPRPPAPGCPVLRVRGARQNNLKDLDVDIPLDRLTAVAGVSGSGKSTLFNDVVWRSYLRWRGEAADGDDSAASVDGFDGLREVVLVDQSPIGRTPRGNAATYTKCFDAIRDLFAGVEDARAAGLGRGAFSFNVEGGRCPACAGAGAVQVEMQFLSDVTLPCEECGGKRFRSDVLGVRWRGRSIDDVLGMTVRDAAVFFAAEKRLAARLDLLAGLGLGYLCLGQPIQTLSGGEAQRLKLAAKVLEAGRGKLLFLIDEPTTGLHLDDVARLIGVLDRLVGAGHAVVVIEHHLDVIAAADHVIELGPEGGDAGGRLVAEGPPAEIVRAATTTGVWLRRHLEAQRGVDGRASGRARRPAAPATKTAGTARARQVVRVVGARENNLRDITVEIPRNRFVVVTGLSGSGKSSLVYDILFAEGQRRYLDCLSPYARQFVEGLHRPDIDHLEGIPPAVAIEQRTSVGGRKSTAGTVTEVYQFLRLLYARAGRQTCPDCGVEAVPRSRAEVEDEVARLARLGGRVVAPVMRGRKGTHSRLLATARTHGVAEARIDGTWVDLPAVEEIRLARERAHDIDLVTGRFAKPPRSDELRRVVGAALEQGKGVMIFCANDGSESLFSVSRSCPSCGQDFAAPEPHSFSFHSRKGMCLACTGHGSQLVLDPERVLSRWDTPFVSGAAGPLTVLAETPFRRGFAARVAKATAGVEGLPGRGVPLAEWTAAEIALLWSGGGPGAHYAGLGSLIEKELAGLGEDERETFLAAYGRETECGDCGGSRLDRRWGAVRVGGRGIAALTRMPLADLQSALACLDIEPGVEPVARPLLVEISSRVAFLVDLGLGYLTLDRSAATLSSGEAQRIRLAAQLGSNLRGALYILDEPTIGLHASDSRRLLATLRQLRDRGNSVVVVEHDDATIRAADEVLDMGPGPGRRGGEVVVQGGLDALVSCEASATGAYFRAQRGRVVELAADPLAERPCLGVRGATRHNLRGFDVRFPFGALTIVTGVSGAGKSTLVRDLLEDGVRRKLRGLRAPPPGAREVTGAELVSAVREVDQMPIGRTPRSTPATYIGMWDAVRRIFGALPESRVRGYEARRFSFNVPGGRCESCQGQGSINMEMSFLPDVRIDCEACGGARFGAATLEILYRGRSIADVLAMAVEEAREVFAAYPDLARQLAALDDLGLGYVTLGQASTTLSGGEAQRIKLAVELAKGAADACLYLFDEPTTGLHMLDVGRLAAVLRRLAGAGHAVVVVEHHLELVAGADWVVDLGPEGGAQGGHLLYEGPPFGLLGLGGVSRTAMALEEFVAAEGRSGPRAVGGNGGS